MESFPFCFAFFWFWPHHGRTEIGEGGDFADGYGEGFGVLEADGAGRGEPLLSSLLRPGRRRREHVAERQTLVGLVQRRAQPGRRFPAPQRVGTAVGQRHHLVAQPRRIGHPCVIDFQFESRHASQESYNDIAYLYINITNNIDVLT